MRQKRDRRKAFVAAFVWNAFSRCVTSTENWATCTEVGFFCTFLYPKWNSFLIFLLDVTCRLRGHHSELQVGRTSCFLLVSQVSVGMFFHCTVLIVRFGYFSRKQIWEQFWLEEWRARHEELSSLNLDFLRVVIPFFGRTKYHVIRISVDSPAKGFRLDSVCVQVSKTDGRFLLEVDTCQVEWPAQALGTELGMLETVFSTNYNQSRISFRKGSEKWNVVW